MALNDHIPQVDIRHSRLFLAGRETNFRIEELIPKQTFAAYQGRSEKNLLRYVTAAGLGWLQFVRDFFNVAVMVNNWHSGGHLTLRGYRPPMAGYFRQVRRNHGEKVADDLIHFCVSSGIDTYSFDTGSFRSIHKFCGAYDFNVQGLTAGETRDKILENEQEFLKNGLTTLEDGAYAPTWVHGDNRSTGLNNILIIRPAT